jgi:ribosomal protein S18 acetylase RimI-like enzyme
MSRPDPAGITIRRADTRDAALLEALARQIWTPHYTPLIGSEQVDYMLDQFQSKDAIRRDIENGYVYDIAFVGNDACGYSATRNDGDSHFLSKLYVRENCRGRGIARMLVSCAAQRARQAGAAAIRLTCNKRNADSLAAYARLGFTVAGECVASIGSGFVMDDYILEKKL